MVNDKTDYVKWNIIPVVVIGISYCISFYLAWYFKIPLVLLVFCALGAFFIAKMVKRGHSKKFCTYIAISLVLCIFSQVKLKSYFKPINSLISLNEVTNATFTLTSEPKPAGSYYTIEARLIYFEDFRGSKFSATGRIKVFFKKEIIDQTLSGGISVVKKTLASNSFEPCRTFVRGATIKAAISNITPKPNELSLVYTKPETPLFINWISKLANFRGVLRFSVMRLLYSWGEAGALLLALISADKNFLPKLVNEAFINCGLAHVLALSGMHISIVNGATQKLFSSNLGKNLSTILGLFAISFFVWFAGSSPSLVRALGMAFLLTIGKILGLKPSVLSTLSAMFILHVCFAPQDAISLSFVLSYGALLGILVFGKAINTAIEGTVPPVLASSFSASFGAQAFTTPIVAFSIKKITLIGLISTSLVSPLIGIFLVCGFISLFSTLIFPQISHICNLILNYFYLFIMMIVNTFQGLFVFSVKNSVDGIIYSVFSIAIGLTFMYYEKHILTRRKLLARLSV